MTKFIYHTPENTTGETRKVLEGIRKSYGFLPNLYAYMAEAPVTVEAYLQLNDLLERTSLPVDQQQIAMLAASAANDCSFCKVAHRAIGKMKGVKSQTLGALATGASIDDPKDRALAQFTQIVVTTRGHPTEAQIQSFLNAGFSKQQILEVILIVSIKTLSNYINHLTQPEPNKELVSML